MPHAEETHPRAGAGPFYGSDAHGVVWGYSFRAGKAALPVESEEALGLMAGGDGGTADGPFLWLHFSTANAATARFLSERLPMPDAFHEALLESSGPTRVERDGEWLLAVLHDVRFDLGGDESEVSTVAIAVSRSLMVTARLRPLKSLDRLRATVRAGEPCRSTAELLSWLLREQADVLLDIVRKGGARTDEIEDKLLERRLSFSRAELGTMRRTLVRLQRLLAPEPAALFRLLSRPPGWIVEEDVNELRQAAEEFSAVVADSNALVERLKLLQEELAALVNEQNNKTLFLLTLVTVLALPFNVVGGLFGMNVGGIPFGAHEHGFAVVVTLVVSFTLVAGLLALRGRRS